MNILMSRFCVHFYIDTKTVRIEKFHLLRIMNRLWEQVLPFLVLIKLRTRVNLLHTLCGAGFSKGMSGVGQDLYDDPIELLLTTMHIIKLSFLLPCSVGSRESLLVLQNRRLRSSLRTRLSLQKRLKFFSKVVEVSSCVPVLNTTTSFEAFFFVFCGQTLQSNMVLSTIGWTECWHTSKTTTLGLSRSAVLEVEVLLLLGDDSAMFQGAFKGSAVGCACNADYTLRMFGTSSMSCDFHVSAYARVGLSHLLCSQPFLCSIKRLWKWQKMDSDWLRTSWIQSYTQWTFWGKSLHM